LHVLKEKENEGQCHYLATHVIIARFNGVKEAAFHRPCSISIYMYEVQKRERERE
jgi:hypothetical protein